MLPWPRRRAASATTRVSPWYAATSSARPPPEVLSKTETLTPERPGRPSQPRMLIVSDGGGRRLARNCSRALEGMPPTIPQLARPSGADSAPAPGAHGRAPPWEDPRLRGDLLHLGAPGGLGGRTGGGAGRAVFIGR